MTANGVARPTTVNLMDGFRQRQNQGRRIHPFVNAAKRINCLCNPEPNGNADNQG